MASQVGVPGLQDGNQVKADQEGLLLPYQQEAAAVVVREHYRCHVPGPLLGTDRSSDISKECAKGPQYISTHNLTCRAHSWCVMQSIDMGMNAHQGHFALAAYLLPLP